VPCQWWLKRDNGIPSHWQEVSIKPNEPEELDYYGTFYTPPGQMFKFNCLGLFKNQGDQRTFYKVTAYFGNKTIEFGLPDWSKTTSTIWCFQQS
jgi:hypothetical protein